MEFQSSGKLTPGHYRKDRIIGMYSDCRFLEPFQCPVYGDSRFHPNLDLQGNYLKYFQNLIRAHVLLQGGGDGSGISVAVLLHRYDFPFPAF